MSLLDFMSVEDEPAPVPEPVVADEPEVLVLGLADGAFVSVPFVSLPVVAGVFVSALEPLPPVDVPLAPALDDEPLAGPLALPAPPLWANADVASIAPATVSAKALIHVFITILLMLGLCCCPPPGSAGLASVRHLPHFFCGGRFDARESRQRHRAAVTRGAIDGFDDAHVL